MGKSLSLVVCALFLALLPVVIPKQTDGPELFHAGFVSAGTGTPETANTGDLGATATVSGGVPYPAIPAQAFADPVAEYPVALSIPSIGLTAPVQQVGTNSKGEMAVPDGNTNAVGWYKHGTVPGKIGSAVVDAHVYAAFAKLKYLKVGESVYVTTKEGKKLRFIVESSIVYALADAPRELLFNRNDERRLNLITCAGKLTADGSTYTHRLIVYTRFAEKV